jgi:hypothetical protein
MVVALVLGVLFLEVIRVFILLFVDIDSDITVLPGGRFTWFLAV